MNFVVASLLIVGHFFGDFVLQSSKMATEKSKNLAYLIAHVTVYTFTLTAFITPYLIFVQNIDTKLITLFFLFVFFTHFITDYFTSKVNSMNWDDKKFDKFFIGLGLDQCLHYISLFAIISYIVNVK